MNLEPSTLNLGVFGALVFVIGMMFRYTEKQAASMSKRDEWMEKFVNEQMTRMNGQMTRSDQTVERVIEMGYAFNKSSSGMNETLMKVSASLERVCETLEAQDRNEERREQKYEELGVKMMEEIRSVRKLASD